MIKFIHVKGNHFSCGYQIGQQCRDALYTIITDYKSHPPPSVSWQDCRQQAYPYLVATQSAFPWIIEEIQGTAEGAGIDFLDLFTSSIEELYSIRTGPAHPTRCADFAARPPATQGHVLLAHNNDLNPSVKENIFAVEWELTDQPSCLTIGIAGLFTSIGINANHLALTGAEVSANDERIGVPRLLIARAILSASTFSEAIQISLHPNRASSYNNIISSGEGEIVSIEGSATDYAFIYPEDGYLVHTNHFVHPDMLRYETAPNENSGSISRYRRALNLMQTRSGPVTLDMLKSFVSDHQSTETICRHDKNTSTIFSALIDLNVGEVYVIGGNPCENPLQLLKRCW